MRNMSQMLRRCRDYRWAGTTKMAPKIGAIRPKYDFRPYAETKDAISETLDLQASKPEIGQVAVARGDAGAAHEQTIDRGNQAAEYGAGRRESRGNSIGHLVTSRKAAGGMDFRDLTVGETEHLPQDFIGVFTQQRGTRHHGRTVGHLDRIADRKVFATLGMIDLDHGAGGAQRLILDQFLHRQDRTAGD